MANFFSSLGQALPTVIDENNKVANQFDQAKRLELEKQEAARRQQLQNMQIQKGQMELQQAKEQDAKRKELVPVGSYLAGFEAFPEVQETLKKFAGPMIKKDPNGNEVIARGDAEELGEMLKKNIGANIPILQSALLGSHRQVEATAAKLAKATDPDDRQKLQAQLEQQQGRYQGLNTQFEQMQHQRFLGSPEGVKWRYEQADRERAAGAARQQAQQDRIDLEKIRAADSLAGRKEMAQVVAELRGGGEGKIKSSETIYVRNNQGEQVPVQQITHTDGQIEYRPINVPSFINQPGPEQPAPPPAKEDGAVQPPSDKQWQVFQSQARGALPSISAPLLSRGKPAETSPYDVRKGAFEAGAMSLIGEAGAAPPRYSNKDAQDAFARGRESATLFLTTQNGKSLKDLKAQNDADAAAMKRLSTVEATTGAFEATAENTLNKFLEAAKKLSPGQIRGVNKLSRGLALETGEAPPAQFMTLYNEATSEMAKVVSGSTGSNAAASDSLRREIREELLNPNGSMGQLIASGKASVGVMQNRMDEFRNQIEKKLSKRIVQRQEEFRTNYLAALNDALEGKPPADNSQKPAPAQAGGSKPGDYSGLWK